MRKDLTDQLFKKYPNLYAGKDLPKTQNLMSYGFGCGDGWFRIIDDLSRNLEYIISEFKAENPGKPWRIAMQVKEKFGGLRFYMQGDMGEELNERCSELINAAELKASKTCEECGTYGQRRGGGWIRVLCDAHANGKPVV